MSWQADSSWVVSTEWIVPEFGVRSFLVMSYMFLRWSVIAHTLASCDQKESKQTCSTADVVPQSFLGSAKCLNTFVSFAIQSSATGQLESSMPLTSELPVDSSVIQ